MELSHRKDVSPFQRVGGVFDLLGSPGKRHPVLAQALACLLGGFENLLSRLRTHGEEIRTEENRETEWETGVFLNEVMRRGAGGGVPC